MYALIPTSSANIIQRINPEDCEPTYRIRHLGGLERNPEAVCYDADDPDAQVVLYESPDCTTLASDGDMVLCRAEAIAAFERWMDDLGVGYECMPDTYWHRYSDPGPMLVQVFETREEAYAAANEGGRYVHCKD